MGGILVWLGVVGTVLALCGILGCWLLFAAVGVCRETMKDLHAVRDSFWELGKQYGKAFDSQWQSMEKLFSASIKDFGLQADRSLADWKQAAASFAKSQQELADNLAALLREIKVSKQLSQGALAVVEQNVLAVDKLWQMVEMIRTGPRTAARIPPPDQDAQGGSDLDQEQAIRDTLANAAARMKEIQSNFQE